MRTAYLCDFDGTVSPVDIGAGLVARFAVGGEARAAEALRRWKAGELSHRRLTEIECARMVATLEQTLDFSRGHTLDPGFAPFVRVALGRGDAVMVVSEGFDFYIADQLERAGLAELPWAANRGRFEGRRLVPEFPWADPSCERCGNCKGQHVRAYRARGYRVVFVGDGLSDRCGAQAADVVFARASLLEWCRESGVAARPFEGFGALAEAEAA